MKKIDALTALTLILIGGAFATLMFVIISLHQPAPVEKCKDGWSTQTENGVVYKTYIPELDECKK